MLPFSLDFPVYCTFGILAHLFFLSLVYPMLPISLDCPFLLPLRYSLTYFCWYSLTSCVPFAIFPVSCVPYVANFSGLSFFIAPSVFSNIFLFCFLCTLYCQFIWIAICLLPLRYFLTYFCPVSCVPYIASLSGFSFVYCPFGVL